MPGIVQPYWFKPGAPHQFNPCVGYGIWQKRLAVNVAKKVRQFSRLKARRESMTQ